MRSFITQVINYKIDVHSEDTPMIRLTIQTESEPNSIVYDKSVVIIGSGSPNEIDLSLPGEELAAEHVKIIEEHGRFTIINAANDPFVTLNSLPFAKKVLRPLDIIQIGHTLIRFDTSTHAGTDSAACFHTSVQKSAIADSERIHEALERTINSARAEEVLADDEIDDLIREVETLAAETSDPSELLDHDPPQLPVVDLSIETDDEAREETNTSAEQVGVDSSSVQDITGLGLPNSKTAHPSEDSYIYDLEDEAGCEDPDFENRDSSQENQEVQSNWNLLVIIFIAIATIAAVAVVAAYITISDRSGMEKMTAAEGVADVAMALTYAQVHHIKPQKQNWSDPEFLKSSLASILPPEYPTFANIDNQGQFTNCPYMLRIYTSSDLSQFLVIAQPEPSVLQWLIPKTAIIVDSRAMEMRNINDLKALNRLLLNANTLDGANALDISELVKQGTLIPLSTLATKRENLGFAPPKALSLIKPGAENLIYNAPRYYHFSESILVRAFNLMQIVGNSHEVARLKQELKEFSAFPDMVLYSTLGMQKTMQAQKALATLVPHNEFLTAYLNYDAEGILMSSHLLLNDDHPISASGSGDSPGIISGAPIQAALNDHNVTAMLGAPSVPVLKFDGGIDHDNPLFLQLKALAKSRQQVLKPLNDKMIALLSNHTDEATIDFTAQFIDLWKQYKTADKLQKEKVSEVLKTLYKESGTMPLAQFAGYVSAAGLEGLAKSGLASHAKANEDTQLTADQIQQQLQKIQQAKDFAGLASSVKETAEMLTLSRLSNSDQLILYQNQMRILTLERLRAFILSVKSPLESSDFNETNRAILSGILESAWVNDPDEYDYYISEFEARMETNHAKLVTKSSSRKTK